MDFNIANNMVAEYKQLRAEIRHYLSRRQNTRNFAYLLSLAVLGSDFITSRNLPASIFIVPPLLISCLWSDEIRRLKAIQRLGTYIRIIIEPQINGLKYETLAFIPSRRIEPISRLFANLDFPILYVALSALCFWKFYESKTILLGSLISAVLLFVMLVLLYEAYMTAKHGEENEETCWKLVQSNPEEQN